MQSKIQSDKYQDTNHLPGRKWLFLGAVFSLSFLIYGSLIPFVLENKPLYIGWGEFLTLLSKGLYIRSRTDLGENYLLMIPPGFFLMGFVWLNRQELITKLLTVVAWFFCFGLSILVEFFQIFIVGRTPALSDILMQSLGSVTGILLWWIWGHKIWKHFFQNSIQGKPVGIADKILWLYLLVLFSYSIVPFDLTINPFAIYQKFKAGRILLIPFSFGYNSVFEFIYDVTIDAAVWIPAGFLLLFTGKKTPLKAFVWIILAVTGIEFAQIF
ncbi:MAG: VanZ family protein, partial [Desulfobacteraceae bacterium]|nr:VanZ family protein [Desulfobacteraceae bacterium]